MKQIHLGIAATIAGMLRLHREETYRLPCDASPEDIIKSESARRTLWVMGSMSYLHSRSLQYPSLTSPVQRNLTSGDRSPVPFSLNDITTLLPCEEHEFSYGLLPAARAALPGSRAAIDQTARVNFPSRSLFASLIQAHNLWGRVARRACNNPDASDNSGQNLWDESSEFLQLSLELQTFEAALPRSHQWSEWFLRNYKADSLDLAYTSIFMALRLSNIVLRRAHLKEICTAIARPDASSIFWRTMSEELFTNMLTLHEGINAYLAQRPLDEGFPPILPFCVYNCGSLALSLRKCPQLCPRVALRADSVFQQSSAVLADLRIAWPVAGRWYKALKNAHVGTLALPADEVLNTASWYAVATPLVSALTSYYVNSRADNMAKPASPIDARSDAFNSYSRSRSMVVDPQVAGNDACHDGSTGALGTPRALMTIRSQHNPLNVRRLGETCAENDFTYSDNFEAELESYLQFDDQWGLMSGNVLL